MKKTPRTSAWILAAALAASPAGHAALVAYEGFNYDVGSLTGQNGGIGFASGWQNSDGAGGAGKVWGASPNVTHDNSTLNWDGVMANDYPTSQPIRYLGATNDTAGSNLSIYRQLSSSAGDMAGAGGVLWMSVIYHLPNRTFGAGLHIGLASGWMRERSRQFEAADTDFVGVSPYSGTSNVWNSGNLVPAVVDSNTGANAWENFSRTVGPALPTVSLDMLLVMKFTFGDSTMVEAMVFAEDVALGGINEAAFDLGKTTTIYADGIDEFNLNFLVINQGRFNNALDEIRIGTTFDTAVIPEPTTALLGGLGLLALLRRRRG